MNRIARRTPLAVAIVTACLLAACQSAGPQSGGDLEHDTSTAAVPPAAQPADQSGDAAAVVLQEHEAKAAHEESASLDRVEVTGARREGRSRALKPVASMAAPAEIAYAPPAAMVAPPSPPPPPYYSQPANTEKYAEREDNPVQRTREQPVSTFSIDVDTGSYANVRRMIGDGMRPPADAVRAEEFLNYFDYGHPAAASREVPFRVSTELAPAPWNATRQLLMIGIKGYEVPKTTLPPANLVFLIDTSGSMNSPDKLPLLKRAFSMLARELRPQDRVSIVVYAGSAGLVLPPTPGDRQGEILAALEQLQAGGSTNGGEGIRLAYAMARQAHVENGVNRVILATDGDFNVGTVDNAALETLVADQRKSGIALTTLGFGRGNYNDALAEKLADVGDGNHAYIDSAQEARKVLVEEMGSTLMTIARDVKIQVEFNPAQVAEYRLIGYENRMLAREDFANDKVDAGDIGAGHEVTALYEITPVGSGAERLPPLRYGGQEAARAEGARLQDELAHLRLRYKRPGENDSRLIETPIRTSQLAATPSPSLRFAASVAGFADLLRGGSRFDDWGWDAVLATARSARGNDPSGERSGFVQLMEAARPLVEPDATAVVSE